MAKKGSSMMKVTDYVPIVSVTGMYPGSEKTIVVELYGKIIFQKSRYIGSSNGKHQQRLHNGLVQDAISWATENDKVWLANYLESHLIR